MAYQYDELGNVIGEYESDEERKKREQQTPTEVAGPVAPPAAPTEVAGPVAPPVAPPAVPTEVAGPVAPPVASAAQPISTNPTYGKMLQVESGNKNFNQDGTPVTSSAGALYAGQVMPSTAQNPGYGITPAQSQTPEEYNRVGQDYFNAMLKKYGNNNDLAAAAYHSGPGNVDKALQQSQQTGQDWRSYLGPQGQAYVQKVGGYSPQQQQQAPAGQPAYLPEAGQFPPSPVNPQNLQNQQATVENQPPVTGAENAGVAEHAKILESIQTDPAKLLTYAQDPNTPDWAKQHAKDTAADILLQTREAQKATQAIPQMNQNQLTEALRQKTTDGSWTKAILFGMLGMDNSAKEELAKLGVGTYSSVMGADGKPYLIKTAANGTPLEGYNASTGQQLNANDLVAVNANATLMKGAQTHTGKMQDTSTGEVYYERTTPNGIQLVDVNGKQYHGPTNNLRPFGIGSDLATKNQLQLNALQNKLAYAPATERAKVVAAHEAEYGPLDQATRAAALSGQPLPQVVGTVPTQQPTMPQAQPAQAQPAQAQPAQAQPAQAQPAPTVAPVTQPVTTTGPTTGNTIAERKAELKARETAGTEIAKKNADVVANAAQTQNTIHDIDNSLQILATGNHNIGPIVSGTLRGGGPIGQFIGSQFETEDARNTKEVMDTVRTIGGQLSQGTIKGHLTNQELSFLTENKPTETSDPQYTKYWLEKARAALTNVQQTGQAQVVTGGNAPNPVLTAPTPQVIMTPAQKAKAELERRKAQQ